jgi:hypothetical protein
VSTLRTLRPYGTAAEALKAADSQDLTPVLAQARLEGDELVLSWPGHDEFTKHIPSGPAGAGGACGADSAGNAGGAGGEAG